MLFQINNVCYHEEQSRCGSQYCVSELFSLQQTLDVEPPLYTLAVGAGKSAVRVRDMLCTKIRKLSLKREKAVTLLGSRDLFLRRGVLRAHSASIVRSTFDGTHRRGGGAHVANRMIARKVCQCMFWVVRRSAVARWSLAEDEGEMKTTTKPHHRLQIPWHI